MGEGTGGKSNYGPRPCVCVWCVCVGVSSPCPAMSQGVYACLPRFNPLTTKPASTYLPVCLRLHFALHPGQQSPTPPTPSPSSHQPLQCPPGECVTPSAACRVQRAASKSKCNVQYPKLIHDPPQIAYSVNGHVQGPSSLRPRFQSPSPSASSSSDPRRCQLQILYPKASQKHWPHGIRNQCLGWLRQWSIRHSLLPYPNTVQVKGEAQGSDEAINQFVQHLNKGPSAASVSGVEHDDISVKSGESGFNVK